MKYLNSVVAILLVLIVGNAATAARTKSSRKKTKAPVSRVDYTFRQTPDGYKSPLGKTYKGRVSKDLTAIIYFKTPDIASVKYCLGDSDGIEYNYAWQQVGNNIFISDENDPLQISENGLSLTSVFTGVNYNISSSADNVDPNSNTTMVFIPQYGGDNPWLFSTDGSVRRSFDDDESGETGTCTKLGDNVYKVVFETKPDYPYQHHYESYILVGDNAYNIYSDYASDGRKNLKTKVEDFTYNPQDSTVTITRINGSTDVTPYLKDIRDADREDGLKSATNKLSTFQIMAEKWNRKTAEDVRKDRVKGSFYYKGKKFQVLKNGSVVQKDRSCSGIFEEKHGGKDYHIYTWSKLFEGGDAFLIVGNKVYPMDVGCCSCVYTFDYNPGSKKVTVVGGCDGEEETVVTPLSRMKPASQITWYK